MKKIISVVLVLIMVASLPVAAVAAGLDGEISKRINEMTADIISVLSEPVSGEPAEEVSSEEPSSEEPDSEEPTTKKEPATKPDVLYYGDVNQDGIVSATDARMVLRFCAQQGLFSLRQCALADCDRNKTVSAADARTVLRIAAKLEKLTVYTGNDSDTTFVARYDNRTPYKSTVKGFSTNIDDPTVFDKIKALENYCAALGSTATFYYTDVNNQYYIKYNSNRVYRTQCTIKAPYVKSVLQYMESHNMSLNTTIYLRSSQKWKGHYVSNFATGTAFTIREVIYYAIRYSDNTAYQMLFDYFGNKVFNDNCARVGSSLRLGSYIFGETSAEDMAKLFLDIYNYKGKYRDLLFEDMENNTSRNRIAAGVPKGIRVLNKIGSGGGATVGYHDCGIIFTKVPCVLIIYTSFNMDRYFDNVPFQRIASHIVGINQSVQYY